MGVHIGEDLYVYSSAGERLRDRFVVHLQEAEKKYADRIARRRIEVGGKPVIMNPGNREADILLLAILISHEAMIKKDPCVAVQISPRPANIALAVSGMPVTGCYHVSTGRPTLILYLDEKGELIKTGKDFNGKGLQEDVVANYPLVLLHELGHSATLSSSLEMLQWYGVNIPQTVDFGEFGVLQDLHGGVMVMSGAAGDVGTIATFILERSERSVAEALRLDPSMKGLRAALLDVEIAANVWMLRTMSRALTDSTGAAKASSPSEKPAAGRREINAWDAMIACDPQFEQMLQRVTTLSQLIPFSAGKGKAGPVLPSFFDGM